MSNNVNLQLFCKKAEQLNNNYSFLGSLPNKLQTSLKFNKWNLVSWKNFIDSDEIFYWFLTLFRQFVSDNEPIFINKIRNKLWELGDINNQKTINNLKEWQNIYENKKIVWIEIMINGDIIDYSNKEFFNIFINGYVFHSSDDVKRNYFNKISSNEALLNLYYMNMIEYIIIMTKLINEYKIIIENLEIKC